MNKTYVHSVKRIFCFTMLYYGIVSLVIYFLLPPSAVIGFNNGQIPRNWLDIFKQNAACLLLYFVPYVGMAHHCLSTVMNTFFIGVSLVNLGVNATLSKLVHVPLEILIFSFALGYRKQNISSLCSKTKIKGLFVTFIFLATSAIIESTL